MVSSHSGTPLGVGTSHGHFGPQDTPRPGLGGSHHLPPYSILCDAPPRLHPNGSFSRDSQVGVPNLSRNCPGWSPRTLGAHNSRLRSLIATRSKPNLWPSSRSFQRRIALSIRRSGRGRFPTFNGRESNCQFDVLLALLLRITWATDVQMSNARPFSISMLRDLSNNTKNTSMQGVLGLAVEL